MIPATRLDTMGEVAGPARIEDRAILMPNTSETISDRRRVEAETARHDRV